MTALRKGGMVLRFASLLLGAALLVGCYGGKPSDYGNGDPSVPDGALATKESPQRSGVYPASDLQGQDCCWLAKSATVRVRVPSGPHRLRWTVLLPDFGPYQQRPLTETVTVGASKPRVFARLHAGIKLLTVDAPATAYDRDVDVRFAASYTWTGLEQRLNGDTRQVSVQLKSVRVE